LIRERFFWSQVFCAACERKTQFKVAQWNSTMPEYVEDNLFQAQQAVAEVREESECCCRYCCHQHRALKLGLFAPIPDHASMGYSQNGWPEGVEPMLTMDRPFKCPVFCCCFMPFPWEMSVSAPGRGHIGKALYDFKWYNCCWCCDQHMTLLDSNSNPRYTVHSPLACGGCCPHDAQNRCCTNCCAPSCFSRTYTSTFHDATTGAQVGSFDNQWPGCNARGLCQADSGASNYVLKFPGNATPDDKALLMTGLFLNNFIYFEKRANQK